LHRRRGSLRIPHRGTAFQKYFLTIFYRGCYQISPSRERHCLLEEKSNWVWGPRISESDCRLLDVMGFVSPDAVAGDGCEALNRIRAKLTGTGKLAPGFSGRALQDP